MRQNIREIFFDKRIVTRIQDKLPKLFHLAELESSRAGKIGMEVGSVREKIIVALLIYKFGEENVKTEIPITEAEIDVEVYENPLSIKTITGKTPSGVKLIWTVDAAKSKEFSRTYLPSCDMILIQINWDNGGGFYLLSKETQLEVLKKLGRTRYIKLPKAGTNPRGVELSGQALQELIKHKETMIIPIDWKKERIDFKPFKRWIELWEQK
jgi:hypothetical protein